MNLFKAAKNGSILTKVLLFGALPLAAGTGIVAGSILLGGKADADKAVSQIKTEVTVTYGTPVTIDLFLNEGADRSGCSFASDISSINPDDIASYRLVINSDGHKVKSRLNIVDDVPPVAAAVPQKIYKMQMPDPEMCVTDVYDRSDYTVSYVEGADFSKPGQSMIGVEVVDIYGNKTVVDCPFEIIDDNIAPVISGCEDLTFIVGDIPSFREGITVTDNYDPNPVLNIDNSLVDTDKVGTYPLTYIAVDECGNQTTVTVTVNVIKAEEVEEVRASGRRITRSAGGNWHQYDKCTADDAYAAASKIYNASCGGKNDVERGLKIFKWVNYNIGFSSRRTTHASWAAAACQAFGRRYSSCYGTWAACKALCDVAGIPNRKVWRKNGSHIWCLCKLNGQWYHCDATQYVKGSFCYMMTDNEIRAARGHHKGLDWKVLPPRAKVSVQKYIDYKNGKIKPGLVIITPVPTTAAPATAVPATDAPPTGSPATAASTTATFTTEAPATAVSTSSAAVTDAPATAANTTAAPATASHETEKPADPTTEEQGGNQ